MNPLEVNNDSKKHNEKVDFNYRILHSWFLRTESDAITAKYSDLEVVLGDGTGYKKFVSQIKLERENKMKEKTGQKTIERTKCGEVKIVMGIKDDS